MESYIKFLKSQIEYWQQLCYQEKLNNEKLKKEIAELKEKLK